MNIFHVKEYFLSLSQGQRSHFSSSFSSFLQRMLHRRDWSLCYDISKATCARVGVKYNWSSTQVLQVLVIKYKYKYKYFEFSPIKYSSTSSTDTPSTSTSTKYKYECEHWLAYMYGEYQGGISRELPPCPMITPVQYREIQKGMYTCEY